MPHRASRVAAERRSLTLFPVADRLLRRVNAPGKLNLGSSRPTARPARPARVSGHISHGLFIALALPRSDLLLDGAAFSRPDRDALGGGHEFVCQRRAKTVQ